MDNPEFRFAVQRPAAEIDLAWAALLYARDAYPDLDPVLYLNQLDKWAADLQPHIAASIDPITALNRFLFDDLRFDVWQDRSQPVVELWSLIAGVGEQRLQERIHSEQCRKQ